MRYTRWHSFDQRFWGRVQKTTECWLWTGTLTAKGYGNKIMYLGKQKYPHQVSFVLHHGDQPAGTVIDHVWDRGCRYRNCVRPDHLEAVTPKTNTARGKAARWARPCRSGHDVAHRRMLPSGKNICGECARLASKRYYNRNQGRVRSRQRKQYAERKAVA